MTRLASANIKALPFSVDVVQRQCVTSRARNPYVALESSRGHPVPVTGMNSQLTSSRLSKRQLHIGMGGQHPRNTQIAAGAPGLTSRAVIERMSPSRKQ